MKPSEADAIKRLQRIRKLYCNVIQDYSAVEAIDFAISALEKQEQDRWIPVTEGLPKEDGDYFVTNFVCDKLYVEESTFIICDNGDVFWTSQNVIAWMPKPEPYKAEGGNEMNLERT